MTTESNTIKENINSLNNGQKEVFDYVIKSVLDYKKANSNEKIKYKFQRIKLESDPGTGKSYTVSRIIEYLVSEKIKVALLCPTHTSKRVIQEMLGEKLIASGCIDIKTISSGLQKIPYLDTYGDTTFSSGKNLNNNPDLLIVDEFSMMGFYDLEKIVQTKSTILFVGDQNQVPPVKSKVVTKALWKEKLTKEFILTEQMRFETESQIDKVVKFSQKYVYFPQKTSGNVKVYSDKDQWENSFLEYLKLGHEPICLSYTNKECLRIGELGRSVILPEDYDLSYPFYAGESLRLCSNTQDLKNGSIIEIKSVTKLSHHRIPNVEEYQIQTTCGKVFITVDPNKYKLVEDHIESLKKQIDKLREVKADCKDLIEKISNIRAVILNVIRPWSLTVHKAQGATINYTFVNTNDIKGRAYQRNLLFTGYSRSKTELHTIRIKPNKKKLIKKTIELFNKDNQLKGNNKVPNPREDVSTWNIDDICNYIFYWYSFLNGIIDIVTARKLYETNSFDLDIDKIIDPTYQELLKDYCLIN